MTGGAVWPHAPPPSQPTPVLMQDNKAKVSRGPGPGHQTRASGGPPACAPCSQWRSRRAACGSSLMARACVLRSLALLFSCPMTGMGWLGCGAGGRLPHPRARPGHVREWGQRLLCSARRPAGRPAGGRGVLTLVHGHPRHEQRHTLWQAAVSAPGRAGGPGRRPRPGRAVRLREGWAGGVCGTAREREAWQAVLARAPAALRQPGPQLPDKCLIALPLSPPTAVLLYAGVGGCQLVQLLEPLALSGAPDSRCGSPRPP